MSRVMARSTWARLMLKSCRGSSGSSRANGKKGQDEPAVLQKFAVGKAQVSVPDENRVADLGIYRLEVTPEGTVSAVTLLKSANRMMDVISMKTFTRWRAKPGPLRAVDVFISFGSRWLGPSSPMHPPG